MAPCAARGAFDRQWVNSDPPLGLFMSCGFIKQSKPISGLSIGRNQSSAQAWDSTAYNGQKTLNSWEQKPTVLFFNKLGARSTGYAPFDPFPPGRKRPTRGRSIVRNQIKFNAMAHAMQWHGPC